MAEFNDTLSNSDPDIKFDKNLDPNRSAIADEDGKPQIGIINSIVLALENNNKARIARDAEVKKQANGGKPYDPEQLKAAGLDWQSNQSGQLLITAVAKTVPAFRMLAVDSKYLTTSKLANSVQKTIYLQDSITRFIKSQKNWEELNAAKDYENVLIGRAILVAPDEYDYRYKFYNSEEALLPEDASRDPDTWDYLVLKECYSFGELIEKVRAARKFELENSLKNGWDADACVDVLNNSRYVAAGDDTSPLREEEYLQQGSAYGLSHGDGKVRRIDVNRILVKEIDGTVSEAVVTRDSNLDKVLFYELSKYSRMSEVVSPFFYSAIGSMSAHGSRGLGRLMYGTHEAHSRLYNAILDKQFISGMMHVELPEHRKIRSGIQISNPLIVTPPGVKATPQNVGDNSELSYAALRQVYGIADSIVGSMTPQQSIPQGTEKTATQVTIEAAENQTTRQSVLDNYATQFSNWIREIQRRILNPDTVEEDCKQLQAKLLQVVTREELDEFVNSEKLNTASYASAVRNQRILDFCNSAVGNPMYNQSLIFRLLAEISVDSEFANEIVVALQEPGSNDVERAKQSSEIAAMMGSGIPIKVSPLDSDMDHLQEIEEFIMGYIQAGQSGQRPTIDERVLSGIQAIISHSEGHIDNAMSKGAKAKDVRPYLDLIGKLQKFIGEIVPGVLSGEIPTTQEQVIQ